MHNNNVDFDDIDATINVNTDTYLPSAPPRMIEAAKVSLPPQAATAALLDVLPPHLRAVYSQPSLLLQPPVVKVVNKKCKMVSDTEYALLLQRMLQKNMIAFTQKPLAVNGLFAVDKDAGASLRLIIDARNANSMFIPSPAVSLPTPDIIAHMDVPAATTLYAAKVDLDNFYHRLALPPQWWPYFCLPAIRMGDIGIQIDGYEVDDIIYPMCTTMPMGWSHAVFLAQAAHEHLIDTRVPALQRRDRLVRQSQWRCSWSW